MKLAIGPNGKIGRQIPKSGEYAVVDEASLGERRGNVFLSSHSIEADQAYYSNKENTERAIAKAKRLQRIARSHGERAQAEAQAQRNAQRKSLAFDPMNEKLKLHYAMSGQMGEDAQVIASLLPPAPADFSSSGANPQYEPGLPMTGGQQWRADFRQQLIKGNPLTRDGVFGPSVTDYDRFVQGVDVNQTDVVENVAGGTMLGRLNDSPISRNNMGFDWSWDGITDAVSNVGSQTVDNVVDSLPAQLAKELQAAITGGGKATTSGNTVTVQRPVTGTTTTLAQTIGLPKWALYGGLGLLGIGVTFMMIKAVKR